MNEKKREREGTRRPLRFLIVDDYPDDRTLVKRELKLEFPDSAVKEIIDRGGFAEALRAGNFDAVITDYHLHWNNGLEILRKVRARYPDCPVIMLTGTGNEAIAVEAMKGGLDDYVIKKVEHFARVPASVLMALQRIRERKEHGQAERALRASEEKYRLLVENANDAIFIAQDEVVKFPNPKCQEMVGYLAKELAKMPFIDLIHPDDRDMVLDRHRKRLSGKALPGTYDFRIINKAGEELWVQLNTVLINWEERPATLNFLRDITQQKKLEIQLQQTQKMEAIGTLAGGIAHDFNNLLMGIQGRVSLMQMGKDASHPDFEHLIGIEDNVKSAADLTKQLLGFARGGKYEVKPTNLNEIVNKSADMFGRTKKEIKIHRKAQKEIWTVEVDQGQIEQVLLNIYINAWQAMSGTGELFLATGNVTLDENYVKPYRVAPGRYVKISVTDTGIGMDAATQKRIFDPFFTTKEMDRGTGMGLASAYGIIKNHDGIINVYSEKEKGATFNIYLPAIVSAQARRAGLPATEARGIAQRPESERRSEILRGTETVLLVDDQEMIIDIGKELLGTLGYTVFLSRSGKEAIGTYKKNKDKIDMVLLDMIMPQMSGGDTYDRLKEIDPDIKVLLCSGYSINGPAKKILDRGCNGFIQKPFDLKNLSQKLREILDKK